MYLKVSIFISVDAGTQVPCLTWLDMPFYFCKKYPIYRRFKNQTLSDYLRLLTHHVTATVSKLAYQQRHF